MSKLSSTPASPAGVLAPPEPTHNPVLATGSEPIIELRALRVQFSSERGPAARVLDGIDLDIRRNSFVAVLGPSGCGKTTLLRAIAGLTPPASGDITVRAARTRRGVPPVSMNFQRPVLLPWLSVRENGLLPYRILRAPIKEEVELRLTRLLTMAGLHGIGSALPHELSGGMQMRAALVRSFVSDPEIVLMDEPFAALDEPTRQKLGGELLQLWSDGSSTIVFVTHNIQEAVYLADDVVVMSRRPTRVIERLRVPLERPRDPVMRRTAAFAELVDHLTSRIGYE